MFFTVLICLGQTVFPLRDRLTELLKTGEGEECLFVRSLYCHLIINNDLL